MKPGFHRDYWFLDSRTNVITKAFLIFTRHLDSYREQPFGKIKESFFHKGDTQVKCF